MRIELDSLEGTAATFAHVYGHEELDFNDDRVRLIEPPEVAGQLIRKGKQVILNGRLSACAEVDCDRCLKSVEVPVLTEFSLEYIPAEDYRSVHAAELEESDLGLAVFDGDVIDIDEVVREQILLTVPSRSLCREDCKGFCPVCNADRNLKECNCRTEDLDPRWAGLKQLVHPKS